MKRRLRGDAPAVAQITRLISQATGNIALVMNGKTGVAVEAWDASAIASAWNLSDLPEFAEVTAAADGDDVVLTAVEPGVPFELQGLVNGEPMADDEQLVTISPAGVGGTFPLTFDGQTAAGIAAGATASTVQAALVALSNLGPDDVRVSGPAGGPWRVRFTGARADADQPLMTTSRSSLTGGDASVTIATVQNGNSGLVSPLLIAEHTAGGGGVNEQQRFRFTSDPGSLSAINLRWKVPSSGSLFNGSVPFAADASLATMAAALAATKYGPVTPLGAGNISLSGTLANSWVSPTNGIVLEFIGSRAAQPWDQIELVNADTGATVMACTTIADGVVGTNEVQSLQLVAEPIGPGYRLKHGGHVTEVILWTATAGQIVAALNAVLGALSVQVASSPDQDPAETLLAAPPYGDGIIHIQFYGNGYQSSNVALLEVLGFGDKEIQQVAISPDAWAGQVTLTLNAEVAAPLDWDSTSSEVAAAIEALAGIDPGEVTCSGGPWPGTPIVCEFAAALDDLPQMTATHTLINAAIVVTTLQEGGAAVVLTEQQRSRGPRHWDDPLNWSDESGAPGVPGAGDVVTLDLADVDLQYGLQQRCRFTANATTDRLTLETGRETFWEGQALRVLSDNALPAGLSAATTYYAVNVAGSTLQLATTPGGDAVNITSVGTGNHEVGVRLPEFFIDGTFNGALGLNRTNDALYDEYRPQSLELWADVIRVGGGDGSGSQLMRLDTGTIPTALEILQTGGSSLPGVPPLLWQTEHADSLVELVNGDAGIGFYAEEAAQLGKVTMRGGSLALGRDVTLAGINRSGGQLSSKGATVNGVVVLQG